MDWKEVLARYDDPSAHDAFVNAYASVDHLEEAARYYREHLERHPDDAIARAQLQQIAVRATFVALRPMDDGGAEQSPARASIARALFSSRRERVNLFISGNLTLLLGIFGALRSPAGECGGLLKGSIVCVVKDLLDLTSTWSVPLVIVGVGTLVLWYRVNTFRDR